MLGVGKAFPSFKLKGTVSAAMESAFADIDGEAFRGQWLVAFFWPKDFTFVCPTEIAAFGEAYGEFQKRGANVIGASVDSEFVHLAWKQQKRELADLPFPMLADIRRDLAAELGILDTEEGVAQRAVYIVDPEGIIRFVMVTDMNVGRNVNEVLRVLDALQTGELVPCNWQKGQKTLQAA